MPKMIQEPVYLIPNMENKFHFGAAKMKLIFHIWYYSSRANPFSKLFLNIQLKKKMVTIK